MSYDKQTWESGDVVTSAKLNHMEDGIANAGGLDFVIMYTTSLDKFEAIQGTFASVYAALQTRVVHGVFIQRTSSGELIDSCYVPLDQVQYNPSGGLIYMWGQYYRDGSTIPMCLSWADDETILDELS